MVFSVPRDWGNATVFLSSAVRCINGYETDRRIKKSIPAPGQSGDEQGIAREIALENLMGFDHGNIV
jgi:hypothetical protein